MKPIKSIVVKTSTSVQVPGWYDTFAPKSVNVNVSAWLSENHFSGSFISAVDADATFADFRGCIVGHEKGMDVIDTVKMSRLCLDDSFIRDAIYDALRSIA